MSLPQSPTIFTYDGQNKVDGLIPPCIQSTDWSNPKLAMCTSDVAAMAQTAPRFLCRFLPAASTGALSCSWRAVWQNVSGTPPVLTRIGVGHFTITVPTFVSNEYEYSLGITNNVQVNLFAATVSIEGSTFGYEAHASASGNVINVYTALSGAANDAVAIPMTILAYQAS